MWLVGSVLGRRILCVRGVGGVEGDEPCREVSGCLGGGGRMRRRVRRRMRRRGRVYVGDGD